MVQPFHLALPVNDLEAARGFYTHMLGCSLGREDERWIDFDFFGHQVTVHLVEDEEGPAVTNPVDGHAVPSRHFGVVMQPAEWRRLGDKLIAEGADFIMEPTIRFAGQPGEQGTFFIRDPSGNALEFKMFHDMTALFATE